MAGGLVVGLTRGLGASKMIGGASRIAGATKGLIRKAVVPTTVRGGVARAGVTSMLGGGNRGGGTISPSNFAASSVKSRIGNISAPVSSSSSGGLGDMLTSESIMGRRTGQDTTQDFLDTFGSDKTSKAIRSSLMVLRDTFVETFETARILRTALNQTSGIGGGSGGGMKGKGLLGSPLGILATGGVAGTAGGVLAKKMQSKTAKTAITGDVIENTTKAAGKSDDAAKAGLNLGKNFNNIKKSVGQGLKGAKNIGGNLLQKGGKFIKNPKKALGALAIGGLGFLGAKTLTGGGGNREQDVVTKLDSVLDKWSESIDDQSKDSDQDSAQGGEDISTSSEATLQKGKVTSGSMSQADADKAKKKLELESAKFDAISTYGYKSPEANEVRKKLMMLSGTPEEAIYTDKKGNLRTKGYSTYDGKTTVSGGKKQKRLSRGGGFGLKRMIGGAADFATAGMFDFDKRNRKGAPKDFGIRRIAGGLADWATMGLTDFDKRGKGNLQFNPLFGGKDKAWGDANEQAKRGEKQSGFGLKRGIGGALDFATLGMFDFDKRNTSGAPKGFGLKRIMGGVADAITAGATDFDKRGTGIGQMNLGEKMRMKKRREAYENNPRVKNFREQFKGSPQSISSSSNVNAHFDIQSGKGYINGREVSMDEYTTFHNLSLKEKVQKYGTKVTSTPQNTSVPKDPKKNVKVVNIPSPTSGGETNSASSGGGGSMNVSGSSGGGPSIAFPPSHNGVSYAAVETQSQMNLVMAD